MCLPLQNDLTSPPTMSEWGREDPRLTAEEVPPPPAAEIPALRGASSSQQQQPWTPGPPSSVAHLGASFAAHHSPVKKTYSNPGGGGGRDPQNAAGAISAEQQLEPRGQSLPRNVAPPTRQDHALFSFSLPGYLSEYGM
jgi:hypothetical protein